ncbi:MAG: methylated-DNA--[protein]-cysteine S-methyltransferase [Acidimicrobiia bacterium]|nr:methylated-DNA--[protein]-cysteine S-methyltransferase [Acidimicrobiia bacterium]
MITTAVDQTLFTERLDTPLGTLVLMTGEDDRVRALDWSDYEPRMDRLLRLHHGHQGAAPRERARPSAARRALEAYFEGVLDAIDAVTTRTNGTPFQERVWAALRHIPAGRTLSYSQLADAIGQPRAVRAVGLANGANPVGIIVPCHRVIGADGSLTGYGGGLERKRWLLAHEGAITSGLLDDPRAAGSSA